MKYKITPLSLIFGFLLIAPGLRTVRAQEPTQTKTVVKKVPVQPTTAVSGQELYRHYCAVCHGTAGKGDGPAAPAFKTPPADLTQIAAHNGGKFPIVKVERVIKGDDASVAAHGTRDMPTWGEVFERMAPTDMESARIYNLAKYLEGMQAK